MLQTPRTRTLDVNAVIILATALLMAACSDPAPRPANAPSASTSDTVDTKAGCEQFAREGLKLKARSRNGLDAEVGRPARTEVEIEQNRHDPAQQDSIIRLHYEGLVVQMRKPGPGGEMFEYVSVGARKWLNFPYFKPGVSAQSVIAAIGEPQRRDGNRLIYTCGEGEAEEDVVFETDGTTVQRIVFNYYVD
jgi:hypothetical protein